MATVLTLGDLRKEDRIQIFVNKIWKYNSRKPQFLMVDDKSFTASGCIVSGWEYDATSGAAASTLKTYATDAKKELKSPTANNVMLVGKVGGRGSVTEKSLSKFVKTAEFGGQVANTSTGKIPAGAAATRAQEKGSTYIFLRALKDKKRWNSVEDLMADTVTMKELNDIWQKEIKVNVNEKWLSGYWKQQKKILEEFKTGKWSEFDHSGPDSFMDYISGVVKKEFQISKKDNWNPADMWLITGKTSAVKKKINAAVGSGPHQTIHELNNLMRQMYIGKELVGISLKAISGKEAQFSKYNVDEFTQSIQDAHTFPKIKLIIDLGKNMTQDSKVELRNAGGTGGFNFQIKSNSSTSWTGLKWESTPQGATAARGGKAEVAKVIDMLKKVAGVTFDKKYSSYPKNAKEFQQQQAKWEKIFIYVKPKAETGIKSAAEFVTNISAMFKKSEGDSMVANSKLMQLQFLYDILQYKNTPGTTKDQYEAFWMDLIFLSIKLGTQFGPFGKLY